MNCKSFDHNVADWVKGFLSSEEAARMESHQAVCSGCAKFAALERAMSAAWKAIPEPREAPEMWPRIAARLERPEPKPRFSLWPRQLALGGSLALAGALCALVFVRMSGPAPGTKIGGGIRLAEAPTVIEMVHELQKLPDPDSEGVNSEVHDLRQQQQLVLLGGAR